MSRTLHLKFVVNGDPCHVSVLDTLMFSSLLQRVLDQSGNKQPLKLWELRRPNGALMAYDPQAPLHASNIDEVQTLYLTLKLGANG